MATIMRLGGGGSTAPEEPDSWEYLTTFIASGTYTEAQGSWLRIWAHGSGGNGGNGGGAYNSNNTGSHGGGGGSGSNGAVGCWIMYLKKGESFDIEIDSVKTQVVLPDGMVAYAENGRTGGDGQKGPYNSYGAGGTCPTVASKAYGFNIYNIDGLTGNNASNDTGGSAAPMTDISPYSSTPPASGGSPSHNNGSSITVRNPGGNAVSSSTPPVHLGGAGGGGSGIYSYGPAKNDSVGTVGGTGAIGGVVIEKGVTK